ncbi:MAG: chorismate-binding protein [Bacteriovorax sp.]|nr:chorismate-binding protein [Bacteriovorax sp.]
MTENNLYTIIPYQDKLLKFTEASSARAYFKNHYVDLITGKSHEFEIEGWLHSLDFRVIDQKNNLRVIHLFYEMGFIFENLSEEIISTDMLAIDIEYTLLHRYDLAESPHKINLSLTDAPHFYEYEKKFNSGYEELKKGNCYQFNLTGEYLYSFDEDFSPEDFVSALWKNPEFRGAYGSATYCEYLDKMFLSNSPECLFQYSEGVMVTRPIKGTLKRRSSSTQEIAKLWRELAFDKKSEGELYMITDLLRSDLCRIDLPRAVVTKKKAPLLVPGLIHQYSEIQIELRSHVTLKNILEKIFPGGSITGAPKKRVMQILKKLELRPRRFYCGSTIIFSANEIQASINIRSSEINFENSTLSYQAGGGITLLSTAKSEFEEMTYKHDSYIDILTL